MCLCTPGIKTPWCGKPGCEAPVCEPKPRPHLRDDGIPTRCDMAHWSKGERAIYEAMQAVERMGASPALTEAVTLLAKARDFVADHVEGKCDATRIVARPVHVAAQSYSLVEET